MGIVTTTSETAFARSPETIYDFVTNPANWPKTYPGSAHITNLPVALPLKVGDTWQESGADGDRIFTWQLAIATRPKLWMFNSIGPLGHDVLDPCFEQVGAHVTSQVAVGDDADEVAHIAVQRGAGDADAAEALRRHLDEGI